MTPFFFIRTYVYVLVVNSLNLVRNLVTRFRIALRRSPKLTITMFNRNLLHDNSLSGKISNAKKKVAKNNPLLLKFVNLYWVGTKLVRRITFETLLSPKEKVQLHFNFMQVVKKSFVFYYSIFKYI